MELGPTAALKLLLPRCPLILKTALLNLLSLSKNSSKQGLITEVTVAIIRSMLTVQKPLSSLQRMGLQDPGVKGRMWISKVTVPAPSDETGPRDALIQGIKELGNGTETYRLPEIAAVDGEWTGYRSRVTSTEPRLDISEAEQYEHMMKEVSSPVTILYFHGGAYFLMSPASHRNTTSHLAQLTGGRCFSVAYRLAPQNPFPAQLLDALIAYLYLLAPPPGSSHEAVPAQSIVFAGDSAGGNLSLVLLLLILTLRRTGVETIKFHDKDVPVEVPGGCAVNSPWCDIGRSLPSIYNNAHFDYLDPPSATGIPKTAPLPDAIWPSSPPRAEIYCDASMLSHPLASPLAADAEEWHGMPPVFMCVGNEGLEDEVCITTRRMHQGGGTVEFVGYEGMPHCFAMVFPTSLAGKDCFARWAAFCRRAVSGEVKQAKAMWMKAFSNPLSFEEVPTHNISTISDEEVEETMKRVKSRTMARESDMLKIWHEKQSRPHL